MKNGGRDSPAGEGTRGVAQARVDAYFDSTAEYWDRVYRDDGLQGLVYLRRQAVVLSFLAAAAPRPGASVLEVGCGAGRLTVELAAQDLAVEAVDSSEAMVEAAAKRVREAGPEREVNVAVADVHALPFAAGHFDLVVAVGVIPWLHTPSAAIAEMVRVLRPQGGLVLTADNRNRLTSFTDPRALLARSQSLRRMRRALRGGEEPGMSHLHARRDVDDMLREADLRPLERATVGFGPFTLLGRPVLEGRVGVRIDQRLQALADRGVPLVRGAGWHYVVSAVKR